MTSVKNLWPTFEVDTSALMTVRKILLEASEGFKEATKGVLEMVVDTTAKQSRISLGNEQQIRQLNQEHRCSILLPKHQYKYLFFSVNEEGLPFPVSVMHNRTQSKHIDTEQQLIDYLGGIFKSESTKNLVEKLLLLAAAES